MRRSSIDSSCDVCSSVKTLWESDCASVLGGMPGK